MTAALAREYDSRLDFAASCHNGPPSRYMGCSSLAPAIATGISRMDRDCATHRQTPSAILGRHYPGEWPLERRLAHAAAMREFYAGRKAALAKARAAKRRASGMRPGCPFEPKGGRGSGQAQS